jgi:AcrR family transcriptional regulator
LEAQPDRPAQQRVQGKRASIKEQNRRLILDAARRVFAESGYGGVTVRDIIRATPLASGTFYNYFRSKEEIFQAMRDETALALRPVLRDARRDAGTSEAFVAETFRAFFTYVAQRRGTVAVIRRNDAAPLRVDTPEVLAGFEELKADVEAAIARGLFAPVDAEYLAASMLGIACELAEILQWREIPEPDEIARFATALVLGGLAALPKPVPPKS